MKVRSPDPFSVLDDPKVVEVLRRLHQEASRQLPRLLAHYLPSLPGLWLGKPIEFRDEDASGFYADKFIALEPAQGAFCYQTVRAIQARRVVEFGSSFGVSTIWLAAALRDGGSEGQVIGTELVPSKAERAMAYLAEAGLDDYVDMRVGDARSTLEALEGPVDFLLNDGFPGLALEIVHLLRPALRLGSIVLTDNVGTFPANYRAYVNHMRDPSNGFASTLLPFKSGTEYSVLVR
ncbi:MAG: class I SAM-dependent methyltransferase [Myxococcota bacterium]